MIGKFLLLFNTVKHLRFTQIYHQLYYRLKAKKSLDHYLSSNTPLFNKLKFEHVLPKIGGEVINKDFTFLNINQHFENETDWNFQEYGKLWNYNLQYFNWLLHDNLSCEYRQATLSSIELWLKDGRLPLEPYPVSLRVMNTIRFGSKRENNLNDNSKTALYAQLNYLSKHLEFHLLGNHLLENAFALLMGGYAFNIPAWQEKAKQILYAELKEQVLNDGAHFELSPMYHQIIVFRVLELIEWYSPIAEDKRFLDFIIGKASNMLSWLKKMTFRNGDIPHFNDSADGISYATKTLSEYYKALDLPEIKEGILQGSGYRKFTSALYECAIDVGAVGPSYQPGHAHADALSFILHYNHNPIFVEQGTSTYQIGERRAMERSTQAHNSVVVNEQDQSQVWGGFRVAKRAEVSILKEEPLKLSAEHNGYKALGITHQRDFSFFESRIELTDYLKGKKASVGVAYFHLTPNSVISVEGSSVMIKEFGSMYFEGAKHIKMEDYLIADGYNKYQNAPRIIVNFETRLKTVITLETQQPL